MPRLARYLRALPGAFYSRALYQAVARHWPGVGLMFVLLLVVIESLPRALATHQSLNRYAEQAAPRLIAQVPRITIRDGKVQADTAMPHVVVEPLTKARLLVIDTTGATTGIEDANAQALLTDSALWIKVDGQSARRYDLAPFDDITIDQALLQTWVERIRQWGALAATTVASPLLYGYRIVQVFLYGLIGLLLVRLARQWLPFSALTRLAAVALTPAVALDMLALLAGVHIPGIVSFMLAIGYLNFGIRANQGGDAVVAA